MPRPRARPEYTCGDQWIAEEPGRPGWYRFWLDQGTGRTRRASLRTKDLEVAKARLLDIVAGNLPKTKSSHLAPVLEAYFLERTDHLRSKGPARQAGRLLLKCWGAMVTVDAITDLLQKEFVRWSLEKGHAISYIARNLGVLAASLSHAKIGIEVTCNENAILAKWPQFNPKAAREIHEPTDAELARLLAAKLPTNLRRWILNSMATGGRPEAVIQMSPSSRIRDLGLINLNPHGRRQNKKFRATVRELPVQTVWLDQWEGEAAAAKEKGIEVPNQYCTYASVDSLDTVLRRVRLWENVNVPNLSAYSIRHRVASVLRATKQPRVPGEQISFQLGHMRLGGRGEARTTRSYGEYEPEFLAEAAAALAAWIGRVMELAEEYSHANSHRSELAKEKST